MNSIKWIHENYNYITTNCLLHCPSFHSHQKFLSVLIRYRVHIRKIVQKVTSLQISFCYVSLRRAWRLTCYPIWKVCSNIPFKCEQKPYPICSSWRYKQLYAIMSDFWLQCFKILEIQKSLQIKMVAYYT